MRIGADLEAAVAAGIIDAATRDRLSAFFAARGPGVAPEAPVAAFSAIHVLYYAGGLLVIGAMGLFSTVAFSALGGQALAATAVLYALFFVALGRRLWRSPDLRTPAGLCVAIAVSMAPLAIYGIQDALGLWSDGKPGPYRDFFPMVNASWVYMEIGTVAAAALALRFFAFPFILMIAAVALWFFSMDLAAMIVHRHAADADFDDWDLRRKVSIAIGLAMIAAAWTLDLKRPGVDYGFWLHLFGALILWGAVTMAPAGGALARAGYGAFNALLVGFAVFMQRRIYAVFGAIGLATYLGYLAFDVFRDVLLFSFAASAIGLAIIFLGILFQKREARISAALDAALPAPLRALRPAR